MNYLDRRGTIWAIESLAITALTAYIIHCAVFFRMLSPKEKRNDYYYKLESEWWNIDLAVGTYRFHVVRQQAKKRVGTPKHGEWRWWSKFKSTNRSTGKEKEKGEESVLTCNRKVTEKMISIATQNRWWLMLLLCYATSFLNSMLSLLPL